MTQSLDRQSTNAPPAALGRAKARRLAGEDAPLWLTTGVALLGIVLAVTAVALFAARSDMGAARMPSPPPAAAPSGAVALQPEEEAPMIPLLVPMAPIEPARPEIAAAPAKEPATETSPAPADCPVVFNIPFLHGGAQPHVAGLEDAAKNLRAWLERNAKAILSVEGHTDARGGERRNIVLSYMRARSVARWLAGLGVPEGQMALRGAGPGPSKGLSSVQDASNRVQLTIEGVPGCR